MVSDNGEREIIHAHILMEMSAILGAILKDRRENIFHHAFSRMSLLSFTEWQGRGRQGTKPIADKFQTKQKTAEGTIDWCMTDDSSDPENYSPADTTSNYWRGENVSENIHIIFATLTQMFFVCLAACGFYLAFLFSFLYF